ncbi:MAG: hypothetical protein CMN30_04120 [Sandaracinus sp.]|nr:hypothetical protein [Sandaracinus sp.]|tara:strand:- start:499 stop:1947 length:1449 start_codon:yes stop_codon:yes gene_type:complete
MKYTLPLLLVALFGCAATPSPDAKGVESDILADGSYDSFYDPTVHPLELGGTTGATIEYGTRYHAFDFDLYGDATVTLTTDAADPYVDTVVYLYREGESGWGSYIARNDDAPGLGLFSHLDEDLGAGHYRLMVKGYDRSVEGAFTLASTCTGEGCAAPVARECLFGSTFYELRHTDPRFTVEGRTPYTSVEGLSALRKLQILTAVRVAYTEVTDSTEALAAVDAGEVIHYDVVHAASGLRFAIWEYGAGDNSYGAIFADRSTEILAEINDGDFYECTLFTDDVTTTLPGEGEDCTPALGCAGTLRCNGYVAEAGSGKCISEAPLAGEGTDCGAGFPACGEGLICAGVAVDPAWGLCNPEWMRGTFTDATATAIADVATVERTLYAYGLATVTTDVEIDLALEHTYPGDLLITLINPVGTEAVVFDGEVDDFDSETITVSRALSAFPGDEDANGAWTLRVTDRVAQDVGTLQSWSLTLTSRWD